MKKFLTYIPLFLLAIVLIVTIGCQKETTEPIKTQELFPTITYDDYAESAYFTTIETTALPRFKKYTQHEQNVIKRFYHTLGLIRYAREAQNRRHVIGTFSTETSQIRVESDHNAFYEVSLSSLEPNNTTNEDQTLNYTGRNFDSQFFETLFDLERSHETALILTISEPSEGVYKVSWKSQNQ